jgi:uncharacterized membrane protein YbaN (DUF454 family)
MIKAFVREWKIKGTKSRLYMAGGGIFLLMALVGVIVPVIPQVPFAIISALLFSKGSTRFHLWIRHNRAFGKPVRDWEDHHVVRTKLKIFSTVAMIGGAAIAHWKLQPPMPYIVDGVFALSLVFLWTRKSRPYGWMPKGLG